MRQRPWFARYDEFASQIADLKGEYEEACGRLDVDPSVVLEESMRALVARAVQESNWQEGLYLEAGRTRELLDEVFDDLEPLNGPHADYDRLLKSHLASVRSMKRAGGSIEELAALNLGRAHRAIALVGMDLSLRFLCSLAKPLREMIKWIQEHPNGDAAKRMRESADFRRGVEGLELILDKSGAIYYPMTSGVANYGEVCEKLLDIDHQDLLNPFRDVHVHFFHRLIMCGLLPPSRCGVYRKGTVSVGNHDLIFPAPSAVPAMMTEFCKDFPRLMPGHVTYDVVMKAAEISYRFVRIHPYQDGNGRVSRVLMNLMLWRTHPPAYLKADAKGRHRYGQALRRADRGFLEPLAALISMSLIETYKSLIRSLEKPATIQRLAKKVYEPGKEDA